MRKTILILLVLFNVGLTTVYAQDAMTNSTVIKLVKGGLDDKLIEERIKSSDCQFNTSDDSLIYLKAQGVSKGVIAAMMKAPDATPVKAAAGGNKNDPNVMHKSGIYYFNPKDGSLIEI